MSEPTYKAMYETIYQNMKDQIWTAEEIWTTDKLQTELWAFQKKCEYDHNEAYCKFINEKYK